MPADTIVGTPLPVARTRDIPLVEVSGLAIRQHGGAESIVAVGDGGGHYAVGAIAPGADGGILDVEQGWQVVDLHALLASAAAPLDQLEAVCLDGAGRLVLLQEEPSRVFVVDPGSEALLATLELDASTDVFLGSVWDRDQNSRAESMVLLPGGRALMVKEKRPVCFGLFGPPADGADVAAIAGAISGELAGTSAGAAGEWWADSWGNRGAARSADGSAAGSAAGAATGRLVALASWPAGKRIERLGDISDATVGPDGALYLLSDQSATIARVAQLPAPGERVRPTHTWAIADGPDKCEGLAFAADGTCFVGVDTRKAADNLLVIEAASFGL